MLLRSRNVLTSLSNLNVGNVPKETKKLFQAGADKVTTTLNGVRSTIGNWSQVCNCRSNVCDLSYPTDYANDIFFIISTLYRSWILHAATKGWSTALLTLRAKVVKEAHPGLKHCLVVLQQNSIGVYSTYSILLSFPSPWPFLSSVLWLSCNRN